MARRLLEFPQRWQEYLLALLYVVAIPFLPIAVEYRFTGVVQPTTVWFFLAIYGVTLVFGAYLPLSVGIGIIASVWASIELGASFATVGHVQPTGTYHVVYICALVTFHVAERFKRHVQDEEPFFHFARAVDRTGR